MENRPPQTATESKSPETSQAAHPLQHSGFDHAGASLPPPPLQLASNQANQPQAMQLRSDPQKAPARAPVKSLQDYAKQYPAVSTPEIMGTTEFQELMNASGSWQKDYQLSYAQALNICHEALAQMKVGKVDWKKSAKGFVEKGMRLPSKEEKLKKPVKDAEFKKLVKEFDTELNKVVSVDKLSPVIEKYGSKLWERGKSIMGATPKNNGDRDLYLARLQMRNIIRKHKLFATPANLKSLNQMQEQLEKTSRGMADISWKTDDKNLKRILVTGFDPFGNNVTTNPSGIVAQMMDGKKIKYGKGEVAIVEAVTFPVRYNEFDKDMVEKFAGPLLNDPKKNIAMVMTISLDGGAQHMQLDRFASRNRKGWTDNSGIGNNGIPAGKRDTNLPQIGKDKGKVKAPEYIESKVPMRKMLADPLAPKEMAVNQEHSYLDKKNKLNYSTGDNMVSKKDYAPFAKGKGKDPFNKPPKAGEKAISGPGGDYLSNEIYYRMSQLTAAMGKPIPNIHLHIPKVGNKNAEGGGNFSIGDIYSQAVKILASAVHNM